MDQDSKTIKGAFAELRQAWRDAGADCTGFFCSIELWLMLALSGVTVGGVWLAFMGDPRSVVCLGFALGYPVLRIWLHLRRIVGWPFM